MLDNTHYVTGSALRRLPGPDGQERRCLDSTSDTDPGWGAAAAAVKLGLFGKLGKILIGVVLALKKLITIIVIAGCVAGRHQQTQSVFLAKKPGRGRLAHRQRVTNFDEAVTYGPMLRLSTRLRIIRFNSSSSDCFLSPKPRLSSRPPRAAWIFFPPRRCNRRATRPS